MSAESFPGARPRSPATLLPAPGRPPPTTPDEAEQHAWDQMMQERAQARQASEEFEKNYWWLSLAALAPPAVIAALEGASALAAPFLLSRVRPGPLNFPSKDFRLYAGNNRYARAGMKAHADFRAKVAQKPGWDPNPTEEGPNGEMLRPDFRTKSDRLLELKPDTPSGRRAGAAQARRYQGLTKKKTRPIYYPPEKYR
jgi:hypothetical protein